MAATPLPDREYLLKVLIYNPDTGELFWKERSPDMFQKGRVSAEHVAKIWNKRFAGKPAFIYQGVGGYMWGSLCDRNIRAHRVIWKMIYNEEPEQIDHVDGDPGNNRISNLRPCTNVINGRNQKRRITNRTGITGVTWIARVKRWRALICVDGRNISLGYYLRKEDAITARRRADMKYGFHRNHGRSGGGSPK